MSLQRFFVGYNLTYSSQDNVQITPASSLAQSSPLATSVQFQVALSHLISASDNELQAAVLQLDGTFVVTQNSSLSALAQSHWTSYEIDLNKTHQRCNNH